MHQVEHSTYEKSAPSTATQGVTECNRQTGRSNFSQVADSDGIPYSCTIGSFSSGDYQNHSKVDVNCAYSGKNIMELGEDSMTEELKPECLPEAITEYDNYMESLKQNGKRDADVKQLRVNAKKHLLYMGWHFWLKTKKRRQELCYNSPDGKSYHSLATACKAYLESKCPEKTNVGSLECMVENKNTEGVMIHSEFEHSVNKNEPYGLFNSPTAMTSDKSLEAAQILLGGVEKDSGISCNSSEFGRKWQLRKVGNSKKRKNPSFSCECFRNGLLSYPSSHSSDCQQSKKRKGCQAPARKGHNLDKKNSPHVLRSSTRSRQVVASCPSQQSAKTILSWLIDNDVVLPRQKVSYMCKRDGHAMKEGRVNRDGIKCACCHEVFSLAKFEAHAGCSTKQPSANIFL